MAPPTPGELSQHADALRRLARELVGGDGPWEDLVQGTYLSALQRPPTPLTREWLSQVLRNRARDHHRRRGLTRGGSEAAASTEVAGKGASPEQISERLELHAQLVAAVNALGDPFREAVFLRYFDDLTPTQISRRLGLPLKTVKTRLLRGLALLRQRLDRDHDSGRHDGLAALLPLAFPQAHAPAALASCASNTTGLGLMIKNVALACAVVLGLFGIYRFQAGGGDIESGVAPESGTAAQPSDLDTVAPHDVELATIGTSVTREGLGGPEQVAEVAGSGLGSLTVHVLTTSREPQANVTIGLRLSPRDGSNRGVGFMRSDARGTARFEGLEPGRYYVHTARGGGGHVQIEADREESLDLVVEEGVEVLGLVVDGKDNPIAGASIWETTGLSDWLGGRVVATTDAVGRFHLPQAARDQSLGAFSAHHACSALSDLDLVDLTRPPVEIRLVLGEVGVSLRGVVLDPAGNVVPGAIVAVGSVNPRHSMRLGAGSPESWTPRSAQTDDTGGFHFEGLAVGPVRIGVCADGHPVLQTEVDVMGSGATRVELVLVRGASIEGLVVDAMGEPMPGAAVRAFDQQPTNLDESYVDGGQFNYSGTFGYPSTVADGEGRYVLANVRPGAVLLFANPPEDDLRTQPFAREEIQLVPGTRYRWDPIISNGQMIEGVIRFKSGDPIDEIYLHARHEETGKHHSAQSDADGHFELIHLPDGAYTVSAQFWPRLEKGVCDPIEARHVRPGDGLLELVATIDDPVVLEPGSVHARIDDSAERLRGNGVAMLAMANASSLRHGELHDDAVRFGDVPPGRYRLHLLFGQDAVYRSEAFELLPGEDLDLGTVVTEPAGAARVAIRRPPGTEHVELSLGAQLVGFVWGPEQVGRAAEHTIADLCPGPYVLHVRGKGVVEQLLPFDVRSGDVTNVECVLEPAVSRALSLSLPAGADPGDVHITVTHVGGEAYDDWSVSFKKRSARPIRDTVELPLGRFSITVECAGGLRGGADVDVTHLGADQPAIAIELK